MTGAPGTSAGATPAPTRAGGPRAAAGLYPRYGDQVRHRPGDAGLLKQQQQDREQTHGHGPLHTAPGNHAFTPAASDAAAPDIQTHSHGSKRQPEARRHNST